MQKLISVMLIGNYFKKVNQEGKKFFFSGLSFNSKKCKKNNIFFAINGTKINGNKYINDAIKRGATTIVSGEKFQGIKSNILYIKTKNVRKLLSEISFKVFKDKPKNLIAVTGTNGKSSIADFYYQILRLNKKKVASIGTLGVKSNKSKISVTNTTLDPIKLGQYLIKLKKQKIDNVILEASSHGLKQNRLDGLEFKIGIFTNLSHDHLDYHRSTKDYLNSKLYLFNNLIKKNTNVITDMDIPEYKRIKKICSKENLKLNVISENKTGLSVISHRYIGEKQQVSIKYDNDIHNFELNLIGKIQIKNILMSLIAAQKSNLSVKNIIKVLSKIVPVSGRFEKISKIKNNSCVILDYAHTPDALEVCLKNLKDQFKNRKISIVFGCGGGRDKSKRSMMGKIANDHCEKIYLTDDNPRNEIPNKIRSSIKVKINKSKIFEIPSREKAIKNAIKYLKTGEILVVAGKGHENKQDYGKSKIFFSDRNCILQNIKIKKRNLSNDPKLNILKEHAGITNLKINNKILKASIDSKEISKNDVFFAIKGKKNDGNLFLKEVSKKGISLAIVNKINRSEKKIQQIKVKNTLKFLTQTSSIIRENSLGKIIAVTGSCGKTSVKELLGKILNKFSKASYSPKSFNNRYGVPLSLFNLGIKDNYGIFEIGMDKKGEIDELSKIVKPDIGIITNISYAHAKNFKNIKQIALAKSEIIKNIKDGGSLVLNADDKFYDFHKSIALKFKLKIYTFSVIKNSADISLESIKKTGKRFEIKISINGHKKYFFILSSFENNIKNILATITTLSIFMDTKKLNKNIFNNIKVPEGRGDISEIKLDKKKFFLIDESYNSNPLSVSSAIKNFDLIRNKKNKKHLILGDMLELGVHSKRLHLKLSKIINLSSINNVNVFGKYVKDTYKNIHKDKKGLVLKNTSEIINLIKNNIDNNDYLMIKGSNSTGLNKITKDLKKGNNAL